MASTTNYSSNFAGTVVRYLDRVALQVAQRFLVVHQFADKKTMEKGRGVTWTATRWNRLPLPQYPIAEGVPPDPNALTFTQVTGIAVQWAGRCVFTDVAIATIQEDLLNIAGERLGMQMGETKDRNGYVMLNGGTQVNFVNQRGARASLVAGDVMDPNTIIRTQTDLKLLGAPMWQGQQGETIQRGIEYTARESEKTIKSAQHYVSITDPRVLQDLRNNPQVVQTWGFNSPERLYINEMGYWGGMTFCESNLLPNWTGIAQVNGANAAGSLSTDTYTIQVTGSDTQNFYESNIYQVSTDVSVTTGGITVTLPSTAGFVYNVYIGTGSAAAPTNVGLCASGPTSGPFSGQAVGLAAGATVIITGIGSAMLPPAAPTTGVTVYPTYVFGQKAFAALELMNVEWNRLYTADKADPHNQLRVIGYKYMEGWVILNQQFLARIESTASNSGTFG